MIKFLKLDFKIQLGERKNQQIRFTPKINPIHADVIVRLATLILNGYKCQMLCDRQIMIQQWVVQVSQVIKAVSKRFTNNLQGINYNSKCA